MSTFVSSVFSLRSSLPFAVALAFVSSVGVPNFAYGEGDLAIVRVEEDWELIVKSPDENSAGPQVACNFSPYANADIASATFELNHASQPSFVAGGIQLQTWSGDNPIASRKFPRPEVLTHDNEVVKWTQTMEVADGAVAFEIINGDSQTWGAFGGQGYLKTSLNTQLGNLNSYRVSNSVNNSGVSYGANLVSSLTLKRVRIKLSDGTTTEFAKNIKVYVSP